MKLRIEDITQEVKELLFAESEADTNELLNRGPIRDYRLQGPLSVNVSHYRSGMELFFQGGVEAPVLATCARCAEEFSAVNRREFRFVLVPKAADVADSGLRTEDLEFSTYDGEDIELSSLLREQMLLALPTRPLCSEQCRGLCPRCGANRNTETCNCSYAEPDSRLAVIGSLKVQRSAR